MKKSHKSVGSDGAHESDKTTEDMFKINSMKLVRLVRAHEVLYNSRVEGYTDKNYKDLIWDDIYKSLFPQFHNLEELQKDYIRINVRRRWKTLRDSISREVKKNATVENYCRKKESPLISELEFLIPHIRSSYCAKLADALGLRECYTSMAEAELHDEDSYNDLIDLTDELDMKPFIKPDGFQYSAEDDMENGGNDNYSPEGFQIHTSLHSATVANMQANVEAAVDNSVNASWSKEYCSVAEFKGGEFINPIMLCNDNESSGGVADVLEEVDEKPLSPQQESRKRARIEIDESKEVQAKILQLLSNSGNRDRTDQEGADEDRMFLLSLVSDLRRVPAAKKMQVKMEIVTAIARANY